MLESIDAVLPWHFEIIPVADTTTEKSQEFG
jgi:hypothetical protein